MSRRTWLIIGASALALSCVCLVPVSGVAFWWIALRDPTLLIEPETAKLARALSERDNNSRTLEELVAEFRRLGLKVDSVEPCGFDRLNPPVQADWRSVMIDGQWILIAKYDRKKAVDAEAIKDLQHRGTAWFVRGESLEFNGSFVLGARNHPNLRRIEEAFRAF